MARPRDGRHRFITGNNSFKQPFARNRPAISGRQNGRNDSHAGMHGALAITVVEFDSMSARSAQPRRIKTVDPACASRNRHITTGSNCRENGVCLGRDVADAARDHHTERIQQMALRCMPDLIIEIAPAQTRDELKKFCGWSLAGTLPFAGRMHRHLNYFPLPSIRLIIAG